jgi:AcrR family transcriptional regulator
MPRWEPDTRGRLERAAITLFAEHGFEATTVEEIAAAAGLARSGFFRYFRDKSDVFSGGQDSFATDFADAVRHAPDDMTALSAVTAGLASLADPWFSDGLRHLAPKRMAVIASSPDLQERELLKHRRTAEGIAAALRARGTGNTAAAIGAEVALLAFTRAVALWGDPTSTEPFVAVAHRVMADIADATRSLGEERTR